MYYIDIHCYLVEQIQNVMKKLLIENCLNLANKFHGNCSKNVLKMFPKCYYKRDKKFIFKVDIEGLISKRFFLTIV